jgi:hypothetical protein
MISRFQPKLQMPRLEMLSKSFLNLKRLTRCFSPNLEEQWLEKDENK